MQANGMMKALQVLENGNPRLLSGLEAGAISTLFGEAGKEGLHSCIVPTIAGAAHTHLNPQFTQCSLRAIGRKEIPCLDQNDAAGQLLDAASRQTCVAPVQPGCCLRWVPSPSLPPCVRRDRG